MNNGCRYYLLNVDEIGRDKNKFCLCRWGGIVKYFVYNLWLKLIIELYDLEDEGFIWIIF